MLSPSDGPTPEFTTSYFYHEESASLSIVVALQQPGIVYYGATPSFRGREGGCTAGGVYDGKPSLHPLALVLAGPDGAVNDTIPAGFAGTVHKMVPLRTPHQFCILNPKITLFAGGKLYLPLCRPDPKNEIPRQPGFVSVIAPSWLSIYPLGNATADPAYQDYPATINATTAVGGGLVRTTFAAGNARNPRWSTYNNFVPLYFDFAPEHARGGQTVTLSVLIHAEMEDGGRVAAPLWQSLQCTLAPTPTVTPLPTRLVTSFTWASQNLLLGGERGNFLQTYRQLGFNTVPLVGSSGKAGTAPSMFPGNRTGADWDGLFFGPEMSGFVPSTGSDFVGHHRPNASLLPPTVPPSGVDSELQQWARAYAYTNATTGLDIAYRGAFFRQAADTFCNLTAASRPDWVFFDDERWQWDGWLETVGRSANAAAQSAPGESPEMLARRMVTEALGVYTGCLPARSPKTTVGWCVFQVPSLICPVWTPLSSILPFPCLPSTFERCMSPPTIIPTSLHSVFASTQVRRPLSGRAAGGERGLGATFRVRPAALSPYVSGTGPQLEAPARRDGWVETSAPAAMAHRVHVRADGGPSPASQHVAHVWGRRHWVFILHRQLHG